MAWTRLDDKFHDQPEMAFLSEGAVCLFVCALSWSSSARTDGFVPQGQISRISGGRQETVEELCRGYAGNSPWWTKVKGGYQIRSFLKFNPSAAKIESKRRHEAERKAAERSAKRPQGQRPDVRTDIRDVSGAPVPLTKVRRKTSLDFSGVACPDELLTAAKDWQDYRKKSGLKPHSAPTWERLFRKYAGDPARFVATVDHTIEKGWQGLREPDQAISRNGTVSSGLRSLDAVLEDTHV
ncbi:MAG: hypothetical protein JSS66_14625 [Armatimonadetes bacterium]|nr:hypothetical protein [Armatimonadota bacterium]